MTKRTELQIAHDHLLKAYRALRKIEGHEQLGEIIDVRSSVLLAQIDLGKLLPQAPVDLDKFRAGRLKWAPTKYPATFRPSQTAEYAPPGAMGYAYKIEVHRNDKGRWVRERMFFEERLYDYEPKTYPTRLAAATDAIRLCREDWARPDEDEPVAEMEQRAP